MTNKAGLFSVQRQHNPDHPWWKNHSLSIFLISLIVLQTGVAMVCMWYVWRYSWDTFQVGKVPGVKAFLVFFLGQFLLSVVADTYGAWLQVWATKKFTEEGSPASGDE